MRKGRALRGMGAQAPCRSTSWDEEETAERERERFSRTGSVRARAASAANRHARGPAVSSTGHPNGFGAPCLPSLNLPGPPTDQMVDKFLHGRALPPRR